MPILRGRIKARRGAEMQVQTERSEATVLLRWGMWTSPRAVDRLFATPPRGYGVSRKLTVSGRCRPIH